MNAPVELFGAETALFPAADETASQERALDTMLAAALERVASGPVAAARDLLGFREELAGFDFETPLPLAEILDWTIGHLERGVVHVTHPSYFGLFNPAPSFPAICADRIASAFNPQLASSKTSPVPVDIEAHVIRAVAGRAGLPAASVGHFTSGGSEANAASLLCALVSAEAGFAAEGTRAFAGQPVFYVSEDAHLAWYKIALQVGIGRNGVRSVPCDASGRMDAAILAARIESDRARGRVPIMICATAGTTGAGMIDPLEACTALARTHGLWLHVDAAWGGAALASARLRPLLAGCEAADSLTVDAHKWFATTMGCGMFITRHQHVLAETFNVAAHFMPSSDARRDPYLTTAQWSRRFLGLRLFLSLATAGWRGYGAHVDRASDLARLLARRLAQAGWRIANEPDLAVVLAEPPDSFPDARMIADEVVASGAAWLSSYEFRGRDVLRMCITNGRTSVDDVLKLVDRLGEFSPGETEPHV